MNRVLKKNGADAAMFMRHRSALVDYASPIVGCRARAEDVVQEAYIRFAAADAANEVASPTSYLYRIVRNLAIDTVRREHRQSPGLITEQQFAELPVDAPSVDRVLDGRRRLAQLEAAVAELPERTRRIFILNRLHGLTYQQIADELDVSISTVQKHLMQALAHAMSKLDD